MSLIRFHCLALLLGLGVISVWLPQAFTGKELKTLFNPINYCGQQIARRPRCSGGPFATCSSFIF